MFLETLCSTTLELFEIKKAVGTWYLVWVYTLPELAWLSCWQRTPHTTCHTTARPKAYPRLYLESLMLISVSSHIFETSSAQCSPRCTRTA